MASMFFLQQDSMENSMEKPKDTFTICNIWIYSLLPPLSGYLLLCLLTSTMGQIHATSFKVSRMIHPVKSSRQLPKMVIVSVF
jgi:hypothetical protein